LRALNIGAFDHSNSKSITQVASLDCIKGHSRIEDLTISQVSCLSPIRVEGLPKLKSLKCFEASPLDLESLETCPSLIVLDIRESLVNLPRKELCLESVQTGFFSKFSEWIDKVQFPNISYVSLECCEEMSNGLSSFPKSELLATYHLGSTEGCTIRLSELSHPLRITELTLVNINVSNSEEFCLLRNLKILDLAKSSVNSIDFITQCHKVVGLRIQGSKVHDISALLSHHKRHRLKTFSAYTGQIPEEQLKQLQSKYKGAYFSIVKPDA
jgi:hypothetical protein